MQSNQTPHRPTVPVHWVFIGLIALAVGAWASFTVFKSRPASDQISGTLINASSDLKDFKLITHNRQAFSNEQLKGRWSFVFFGYTHCPDVCPNTMTVLNVVANELKKQEGKDPVQYVFVSVDPERDTPEQLAEFIKFFNKDFIAVTAPITDLKRFTDQLGIIFMVDKENKDKNNRYLVDHSAHILVFNPQGRFQALLNYPHDARKLLADYATIRAYTKQ